MLWLIIEYITRALATHILCVLKCYFRVVYCIVLTLDSSHSLFSCSSTFHHVPLSSSTAKSRSKGTILSLAERERDERGERGERAETAQRADKAERPERPERESEKENNDDRERGERAIAL
jgi:hypothetical protein